MINQK